MDEPSLQVSSETERQTGQLIPILIRILKYLVQFAIVAVLLWQIYTIGLANILRELPRVPLFYVIFLMLYFALPLTEFFTYRQSFPIRFCPSQLIFLKKRIYNTTVIGYLGEVQLFSWLQKEVGAGKKRAFEVVRDNNTLSTAASTTIVLLLLSGFVLTGQIAIFDALQIQIRPPVLLAISVGVFGLMVLLVRRFRRYLFSMNRREGWTIFLLHTGRMLMLTILQMLQWYVVMPDVALSSWFTLLSVQLILSRIPFLPNKDLVFLAAGVGLGGVINIEPAAIAGILLAHQVLDKAASVLIFAGISVGEARSTLGRN